MLQCRFPKIFRNYKALKAGPPLPSATPPPLLEHLQGLCKQTLHCLITKKSRKYLSNGFANKVCNLVNFANRG